MSHTLFSRVSSKFDLLMGRYNLSISGLTLPLSISIDEAIL